MSSINPVIHNSNYNEEITKESDTVKELHNLQDKLALFDFHTPLPEKRDNTFRLFYNNCNGIAIINTINTHLQQRKQTEKINYIKDVDVPTKLHSLLRQMNAWEVDVTYLAEFNTAWEDKTPRKIIKEISRKYDQTGCWTVSTSSISVRYFVKLGGTATITMNDYSGKLVGRGTDPWKLGRWSYVIIAGKKEQLLIVTGYRLGKRTGKAGPTTA